MGGVLVTSLWCSPASHQLCQPGSHPHTGLEPGGLPAPGTAMHHWWGGHSPASTSSALACAYHLPAWAPVLCWGLCRALLQQLPILGGPGTAAMAVPTASGLCHCPFSGVAALPSLCPHHPPSSLGCRCHLSPQAGAPWAAGGVQPDGAASTVGAVIATARQGTEGNWPPLSSCLSAGGWWGGGGGCRNNPATVATPRPCPGPCIPTRQCGNCQHPPGDRQCRSTPGCCCR